MPVSYVSHWYKNCRALQLYFWYFALEEQRARLWTHFENLGVPEEGGIYTTTDPIRDDALGSLGSTLDQMPDVRLIIVDPLFKFIRAKDSNDYAETSALLERLPVSAKNAISPSCALIIKKKGGRMMWEMGLSEVQPFEEGRIPIFS